MVLEEINSAVELGLCNKSSHEHHHLGNTDTNIDIGVPIERYCKTSSRAFLDPGYYANTSDPRDWTVSRVQEWLDKENFFFYTSYFRAEKFDGDKLLSASKSALLEGWTSYALGKRPERRVEKEFKQFWQELCKLKENEMEKVENEELRTDDILEFRRRLKQFKRKYDRIFTIQEFVDDNRDNLPSIPWIQYELDVTRETALGLLRTFKNLEEEESNDLHGLFEGYDPDRNQVIFWTIVFEQLKSSPSKALWDVLQYIAKLIAAPIALQLLEVFKFQLTKFDHKEIDKLCQFLVFGAQFPLACALRISAFLKERGEYDTSRAVDFNNLAKQYVQVALALLNEITSDHFAMILLETKTDIENSSPIELALKYRIVNFIKSSRIERVYTSMYQEFNFLRPEKKDLAFKINQIDIQWRWQKLQSPEYYFLPIGYYHISNFLFFIYIVLFSVVTHKRQNVYSKILQEPWDIALQVCNVGYATYEVWDLQRQGVHRYFEQWENRVDFVLSTQFTIMLCLKVLYGYHVLEKNCEMYDYGYERCNDSPENVAYTLMQTTNVILMWFRFLVVDMMDQTMGPLIQITFNMGKDVMAWLRILVIFMIGFLFASYFLAGDVPQILGNEFRAFITLFRAMVGEFEWNYVFRNTEGFAKECIPNAPVLNETKTCDPSDMYDILGSEREHGIQILLVLWMVLGCIVLLNLLIAMMTQTYEAVQSQSRAEVTFQRVQMAQEYDKSPSLLPPPLNLLVFICFTLFTLLEIILGVLFGVVLNQRLLAPSQIEDNLVFDDSIINRKARQYDSKNKEQVSVVFTKYYARIGMHCIEEIFDDQMRFGRKRPRVRKILAHDLHNRNQLIFEDVDNGWLHRFFEKSPQSECEDEYGGACCYVSGCKKYQQRRYSALKYIL